MNQSIEKGKPTCQTIVLKTYLQGIENVDNKTFAGAFAQESGGD